MAGTVNTAAQPNITSVGTLGALTVSGDITANGNIVGDSSTNITGIAGVTATTLSGTLQTAAQTNITSVGTLTGLDVNGHSELDDVNVSGAITATTFTGNLAGTVNTAAQTNITSLGTLSALTVSGDITANGNIAGDNSTNITGIAGVTATTLSGTLQTAAQTNVTSIGTLTGLDVNGHTELDNVNVSGIITTASLNATGKLTTTGIGISIANGAGNTAYIEGPSEIWIDPHPFGVGQTSGSVRIRGDLYVDGTEFIVDVDKIELGDFNIGIASTVSTNSLLDGAGLGIGATSIRKFITWNNATSALMSSENWNLASGKHYEIAGTDVLTSDTLGSGVINSSLTSVGTLGALTVSGNVNANGNIIGDSATNISGINSVTATSFYGSGSNLIGINAGQIADVGVTIREEGSLVGTASSVKNINFVGSNLTATASGVGATITLTDTPTFSSLNVTGTTTIPNISGVTTFANDVNVGTGITFYASTGIISATAFYGDGQNLNNLINQRIEGLQIFDEGVAVGTGYTFAAIDVVGNNVSVSAVGLGSTARITVSDTPTFDTVAVTNNITGTGDLILTDTDAGSSAGPEFKLFRNSSSPADADYLGQIKFAGESDTGVERNYAKITGKISDASNGTEDGIIEFAHIKAGSQNISARFKSTELQLLNGTALSVDGNITATSDITANGNIVGDNGTNITGINIITATDIEATGGFTGDLSGNATSATSATTATNVTVADESSDTTCFPLFATAATGDLAPKSGSNLTFNSSTGTLTATSFSGSGASLTAVDAATLDGVDSTSFLRSDAADTKTSGDLTFSDDVKAIFGTGSDLEIYHSGGVGSYIEQVGDGMLTIRNSVDDGDVRIQSDDSGGQLTNYFLADGSTGEAILYHYGTQKLATKSGGVTVTGTLTATTFSGAFSGNATSATTATNVTVADESSDTTCFPLFATAATGDLAPKSGSNLTFNSSNGTLTATSFSGALTGNADTATTATNFTVTGNNGNNETVYLVFVDGSSGSQGAETDTALTYNPSTNTFTAGTFSGAHSGNGAGLNSLDASELTSGVVPAARMSGTYNIESATFTVTANNSANETVYPVFVDGATGAQGAETDTGLSYNPSTGLFTAVAFSGSGASLTAVDAATLDSVDSTSFLRSDAADSKTSGNLRFNNSVEATFGTSDDLRIYHESGISYIRQEGVNNLVIEQTTNDVDVVIKSDDGSGGVANYFVADGSTGEAILYHYGTQKLATKSGGVTVTGTLTATSFVGSGASLTSIPNSALTNDSVSFGGVSVDLGASDDTPAFNLSDATTSEWVLGANGSSDYTFTGPGLTGAENDPSIYLVRGQKYNFKNSSGGHPFRIQSDPNGSTGTQYNDGITNNDAGDGVTLNWNVQFDAPDVLYYQCTSHAAMGGKIYIGNSGESIVVGAAVTINSSGINATGVVTATSFVGDGSSLTNIVSPSSNGEFYTGITSSRQIAPLSFESTVFTFPSTAGRQYVIESINVANVDASVGVGTTVNIIASIQDATAAEQTYIAYNVPIVTGGLIELLKNPIVAGPSDVIRMWSTNDGYAGVNNATDVYVNYTEFTSTDYISKFASTASITSTDTTTLYTSTSNPTTIEKIGFANRTDTGDFPISIKITNGTTTSYLAKDLIIPRYSTVDILDRPKRIETGAKIEVEVGSTSTVDVIISGKKITS